MPEWVELIPAGEFSGRDGRGPYTLDPAAVQSAFADWGMPLAIDYEHQAFNAAENGQPAPAAGWINALDVRAGALWGQVEWTERAAGHVTAREYRFLSPVFDHDKQGRVLRLLGAGLTNNPNLYLTALNRRGEFQPTALIVWRSPWTNSWNASATCSTCRSRRPRKKSRPTSSA